MRLKLQDAGSAELKRCVCFARRRVKMTRRLDFFSGFFSLCVTCILDLYTYKRTLMSFLLNFRERGTLCAAL